MSEAKNNFMQLLQKRSGNFAIAVFLLGVIVLLGWQFNIEFLQRPLPRLVAMNPLTATCFILEGLALLFLTVSKTQSKASSAAALLACVVIIICAAHLFLLTFQDDFQLDLILFTDRLRTDISGNISNRMAINTSLSFIVIGVAVLGSLSREENLKLIANLFSLITIILCFFSLLGYLYQIPEFNAALARIPMAPHTAIGFVCAAATILQFNSQSNFMSIISSGDSGGTMIKYLLPAAVIVPVVAGYIRINSPWSSSISIQMGASFLIAFCTLTFLVLILLVSHKVNKHDMERKEVENMFRGLLESAPDGIVISDKDGEIVMVNAQAERLFGYAKDELVGKKIEMLLPNRFQGSHVALRQNYIDSPHVREMGAGIDLFARRKDGTEFPVEISLSPLKLKTGLLVTAAIRDVTLRRRSEKKFKDLLESAPDAIVITNSNGIIQLVNLQTEKIFGYHREELIDKSVELLIPSRYRQAHPSHREKFFGDPKTRGMGTDLDLFGMRKSGEEFPVEISLSPLDTEDGMLVSASIRDITERRESEKMINLLASVVESSDDAIIGKALNGKIVSWNAGAEKLFGYTSDEIIGKNVSILVPPDRQGEEDNIIGKIVIGKGVKHYETVRRHKSGKKINMSITVSPILDKAGRVIGASKIARDITSRIRQDAALAEALSNFKDLYDNSPCGYLSVDSTIHISRINQTLLGWLGYKADEVIGKMKFEDLLAPSSREEFLTTFEASFDEYKAKGYVNGLEFDFAKKDGSPLPVLLNSVGVFDKNGEFLSSRTTVFDNTDRKKAEEEIRMLNKELEAFSYSVSHDLRAPLRSIAGYTQILGEDYLDKLDDEGKRVIETITRNTHRMAKLIDDMLQLSRARQIDMSAATINMQNLVNSIISEEVSAHPNRKIRFNVHDLHSAIGDVNLIRQVWSNLITNAIKYTGKMDDPIIEISSIKNGTEVMYKIKDNGAGFDDKYSHKLFGVFQRLHKASDFDGTGVGLAIVKRIIERHNGKVWAEGKVDEGATFYFSLQTT